MITIFIIIWWNKKTYFNEKGWNLEREVATVQYIINLSQKISAAIKESNTPVQNLGTSSTFGA